MGYFLTDSVSASPSPRQKTANPVIPGVESGHRFYSSSLARWTRRDPLGERGGKNLYGLVRNNAPNMWDLLGLTWPFPDFAKECQDIRDEGFSSPGERQIIDEMQRRKCKIPRLGCEQCCPAGENGKYFPREIRIRLCSRPGRTREDYRGTRRHELRHAFDFCTGFRYGCDTDDQLENFLCLEIAAYSWGSGERRSGAVTGAVNSVYAACTKGKTVPPDMEESLRLSYREIAERIYDKCRNRGAPTSLLPGVQ